MVMNGALLLLSRSFCAALLMLMEKKYFIWYSACDMGLYLLLKALRGDLAYWIPIDGALGFLVSLIARVGVKIIADYTGIVQFRGSAEMGGIYWTASMLLAITVPFAVVAFYFANPTPGAVKLSEKDAWRIVNSLSGAWLVFFLLFLALMKKRFRRTFFSFETGYEWARKFFLKGETDEVKSAVTGCNRKQWKKIEGEVKEWVQDNWEQWEEEKPGWFTEAWKSQVPDDWLTAAELRRQKMLGGGQRRRSSLGSLRSVREAKMSATVVPTNDEGDGGGDIFVDAEENAVTAFVPAEQNHKGEKKIDNVDGDGDSVERKRRGE
jgi:hypothetical protein